MYPDSLNDLVVDGYLAAVPDDPFEGRIVPGSNDALTYDFDSNYSVSPDKQNYSLFLPLEEEAGDGGTGIGSYIVYNPEGPKPGGSIPTGGTFATNTPRPANTTIPTTVYSPTPSDTPAPTEIQVRTEFQNVSEIYDSSIHSDGESGIFLETITGPYPFTYRTIVADISELGAINWSKVISAQSAPGGGEVVASTDNGIIAANKDSNQIVYDTTGNYVVSYGYEARYPNPTWTPVIGSPTPTLNPAIPTPTNDPVFPPTEAPVFNPYTHRVIRSVSKVSAAGQVLSSQAFQNLQIVDMAATTDGGVVILAYDSISPSAIDTVVIKMSNTQTQQWTRRFGSSVNDYPSAIKQVSDGGYVVVGQHGNSSPYNGFAFKLSSTGVVQWSTIVDHGGHDFLTGVIEVSGGYVLYGYVGGNVGVTKVTTSGTMVWSINTGSTLYAQPQVVERENGNLMVIGDAYTINYTELNPDGSLLRTYNKPFLYSSSVSSAERTSNDGIIMYSSAQLVRFSSAFTIWCDYSWYQLTEHTVLSSGTLSAFSVARNDTTPYSSSSVSISLANDSSFNRYNYCSP